MGVQSFGNAAASFRSRFGKTGNRASRPGGGAFSATGGNVSALAPGNGYIYHTYTSPGTFVVSSGNKNIEVLVVAGGGGGGSDGSGAGGGGGSGGGLVYSTSVPISTGSYPVIVGSGGAKSTNGEDSQFFTYFTAKGGGGAGAYNVGSNPGGSGGGSGARSSAGNATQPSTPQSFPTANNAGFGGGAGDANDNAGGGGGAGATGSPAPVSGNGGVGLQFPSFTGPLIGVPSLAPLSGYFAGGGGGGRSGSPTSGGLGGGGNGSGTSPSSSSSGTTNSGGGGGGGGRFNDNAQSGGSGIVIVRYLA